jgi:hypothetical protein
MTFDGFILHYFQTILRKISIRFHTKKQKKLAVERDGEKIETE